MKQKETNKKGFNLKRKPWAFLLAALVFSFLFPWFNKVQAADFKLDDLKVRFDTYVNNQPENYFRIGKDGSVTITGTMRLLSPASIDLGSDDLIYQAILDGRITRFAIGFTPQDTLKVCREISRSPIKYLSCNSPDGLVSYNKQADSFQAASITAPLPVGDNTALMFRTTFTLNAAQLAKLGVTNSSPSGTRNQIFIYPMVEVSTPGLITYWGGATVTLGDGGKALVFDYFDTQAQATAAAAAGRPADVDGYGGTTSNPKTGEAGNPLLGFLNQLINAIIGLLQELIYLIFYYLIAPIIQAMLNIRTYTDVFAAVIYPGWEVVRNVCNILFIVALIAIGLGTLFRVESYQYKHLLVDLIIAALLVNFSLVIAQAVLGVADTVQSQFLPNNVEVIRSLARDLMAGWKNLTWDFAGTGYFSNTIQPLFALALSIGSFIVFSALAGFLVVRIVMLWVLLMLSPLAYAMRVLPSTKSYAAKWWGEFLKYAFFTPIIAFFLNMAAVINNQYNAAFNSNGSVLQKLIDDPSLVGNSSLAAFVFRVGSNVIILVFLVIAIKAAEQAGVFGADVVAKAAKGGLMAPLAGVKFLADAGGSSLKKQYNKRTDGLASGTILPKLFGQKGGQWLSRQAFKVLQPAKFVKAVREESKEEKELYEGRVGAAATKVARKQYGWRRMTEDPTYLYDEHKGKELYEKEEGKWSPNEQINMGKINRLAEEAKGGDLRARIKLKYALAEAFRNRNLNEALEGENGIAARKLGGALNYNSDNIRYFFQQMTKEGYLDEDFTREFLKDIGTDAYGTGDYNGAELVYSDPETGHAHLIEMGPRGADGNSLPVGWNEYVTKRTAFIDQADREGKIIASKKGKDNAIAKYGSTATTDQINDEIEKIEGPEIAKVLKKLEDAEAGKNHGHNPYANSMHAERGRNFMKVNLSKKKGGQQLDMFHDSIINYGVTDGEAHVSDAGTQILGKLDEQGIYALLRDNMPPKTKDKFKTYAKQVLRNPKKGVEKIEKDITKIVVDEYREQGVHLTNDKLESEVKSRTNMWLAALAGLASGQQAVGVMKTFDPKPAVAQTPTTPAKPAEDSSTPAGRAAMSDRVKDEFIDMIRKSQK